MKWFGRIALALVARDRLAAGRRHAAAVRLQGPAQRRDGGDARPHLPADRRSTGVEALVGLEPPRPGDDDAVLGAAERSRRALGVEERERRQRRDGVHDRPSRTSGSTTRSLSRTWACAPAGSCVSRPPARARASPGPTKATWARTRSTATSACSWTAWSAPTSRAG